MHFYTNPNCLSGLWKDIFELNPKQRWSYKNKSREVMGEKNIWALRTQNMVTWQYGQKYANMTSSKCVLTHHHIRRFLRWYLVLKKTPNRSPDAKHNGQGGEEEISLSLKGDPFWLIFWNFSLSLENPKKYDKHNTIFA